MVYEAFSKAVNHLNLLTNNQPIKAHNVDAAVEDL